MNDTRSKEFKRNYLKSKLKVRQWEKEFLTENGRLPTKVDIKASPASVKENYKLYWKLKTEILEAEILEEDSFSNEACLQLSQPENVLKPNVNECNKKNEENTEKESGKVLKENIDVSQSESSDKGTWGPSLKGEKNVSVNDKEKCTFLNEKIAGRLFRGSSFKKRNPRRSLSFSKNKSNKSINSEESTSIDSSDVSVVMSPFSDSESDSVIMNGSLFSVDMNGSLLSVDMNGSLFGVESDCSPHIKALITSSASLTTLLNTPENCRVSENTIVTPIPPGGLVDIMASGPSDVPKTYRSLDSGWVERSMLTENKEERKSSDSGFESMEFTQRFQGLEESKADDSSDDDLIACSDNEVDEKSTLNFKKRKAVCSPTQPSPSSNEKNLMGTLQVNKKIKLDGEELKPKTKDEIKRAILQEKIESGKVNENYVKINLKKKMFVRGKKNFNFSEYKKREWRNKKKNLEDVSESGAAVQCYKCGESGHFSRYCRKKTEDQLLEADDYDEGDELATLEEAEKQAEESGSEKRSITLEKPQQEQFPWSVVEPFYKFDDETVTETPPEVYEALHKFGHTKFRPGQEETIMRILRGQSTLLTIATGGGKSLCYQLPAYLYAQRSKCITLVVSPLVSLMEDQVSGSSTFFKVGCLHTNQTPKQRKSVLEDAKNGKLFALLVSPEAVVSGDSLGLRNILHQLPPIAFACIDEVHCISQWSYNFRPSYLMISKVLKEKLRVSTILGLTATATISTVNSITEELGISREDGVIKDIPLPDNLCLSVSRDENKDEALIRILKSSRFKEANSILIYCTRRDECERLAIYIRTRLQSSSAEGEKGSKSLSWNAESYHAGMAADRRKQIQKAFMRGNLRIVVATLAFGMGINKQDIRGVIHYNMPKDFESYVQEVGRAGRDGMPAYCHLFLDANGRDLNELRRHIHSNSVDRHVLRKLLLRVFAEYDCKQKEKPCEGHEIAFHCNETIQALDIPEENIHTLLCYLELHEKRFIKVLTPVYINCKIKSYKGMKEIISAAKKCPPLAYACALKLKNDKSEVLTFNTIEIANKLGWDSGIVKRELKNIEWETTDDGKWKKTGIAVDFYDLGFRVYSKGNMTPSELDEALDHLIQRVDDQEKRAITQLDVTFSTFEYFAKENYTFCLDEFDDLSSKELKRVIQEYFETEKLSSEIPMRQLKTEDFDSEVVAADVRSLICTYRDNTFNGRAVARIFHGIQSPNYPALIWYKCKFWRKHIDKDFNKISRIAAIEILRLKL